MDIILAKPINEHKVIDIDFNDNKNINHYT